MKTLVFAMLMTGFSAHASYTKCPAHIFTTKDYSQGYKILKALKPRFQIGGCEIEVHICEPTMDANVTDDIVGDILITAQNGNEHYITFVFPRTGKSSVEIGTNSFTYKNSDALYDEVNGDFEKAKLEIDLWADGKTVAKVSASTMTSKEHDRFLGIIPTSFRSVCFK